MSCGRPTRCARVWEEDKLRALPLDPERPSCPPLPQGQPFSFDAQRPAIAARGLSEAENELGGFLRQGLDVVVAFPHRGEALRQQALLRRDLGVDARPRRRS